MCLNEKRSLSRKVNRSKVWNVWSLIISFLNQMMLTLKISVYSKDWQMLVKRQLRNHVSDMILCLRCWNILNQEYKSLISLTALQLCSILSSLSTWWECYEEVRSSRSKVCSQWWLINIELKKSYVRYALRVLARVDQVWLWDDYLRQKADLISFSV